MRASSLCRAGVHSGALTNPFPVKSPLVQARISSLVTCKKNISTIIGDGRHISGLAILSYRCSMFSEIF